MKNLLFTNLTSKIIIVLLGLLTFNIDCQTWINKIPGFSFWSIDKDIFGNLYAGTTGSARGIFKSTDGGDTWTNVYSTGTSNYLDIACDSTGRVFVANASNGVVVSTDGGQNFTLIPSSTFGGKTVNAVACGKNGYYYAGATNGGIFVSTDFGATWTNTALQTLSIVIITIDKYNSNIIYAGSSSTSLNGFYRSTDAGLTFSSILNPVNVWAIIQTNQDELFTATTSTGYPFHRSTDGGLTWTLMSNLPSAMRGGCADLIKNIYTSGNGGVFKTTNQGLSFTNFNFSTTSNQSISYLNKIFVTATGTSTGGVYVYVDESIPVELTSLFAKVENEKVILNWSTASEINNKGFEIQKSVVRSLNRMLEHNSSEWIDIGFVNGNGTISERQIYSFIDKNLSVGKINYRLKQIDFDGSFKYYYFNETIEINSPLKFSLGQNYPNPFNPNTNIKYQIAKTGFVTLNIYDMLGNEISTLVNEVKEPGNYKVEFSNQKLLISNGVYFYQLRAGDFVSTKKFVLMK